MHLSDLLSNTVPKDLNFNLKYAILPNNFCYDVVLFTDDYELVLHRGELATRPAKVNSHKIISIILHRDQGGHSPCRTVVFTIFV